MDETESMYQRMADKAHEKKQLQHASLNALEIASRLPKLPKKRRSVRDWLPSEWSTVDQLARRLNRSPKVIGTQLYKARQDGLIERRGQRTAYEYRKREVS